MKSVLILAVAICLAGCGGEKKAPIENGVHKVYFYKGGPVRVENEYKNGQLNGTSITYYKDGVVRSETPYLNGKIHGTMKRYGPNGQLAGEALFKNGVQVSEKRLIGN